MKIYFAIRGEWTGRFKADESQVFFEKSEYERAQALYGENPAYNLFDVTVPGDSKTARIVFATVVRASKKSDTVSRMAKAMALEFATKLLNPGRML